MAGPYKLSYFNVKALAEPIRLLFAYKGIEYEDIRIEKEQWPEIKASKPWGVMPVLEDGDKVLSQSGTILRYLAKKHGVVGENDYENAKCDELVDSMADLRAAMAPYWKETDEEKKAEIKTKLMSETFPNFLKRVNKILEDNSSGYLVGNKLTYADLNIAAFNQLFEDVMDKEILKEYPAVKAHLEKIMTTPGIKEWVEKRPVTPW